MVAVDEETSYVCIQYLTVPPLRGKQNHLPRADFNCQNATLHGQVAIVTDAGEDMKDEPRWLTLLAAYSLRVEEHNAKNATYRQQDYAASEADCAIPGGGARALQEGRVTTDCARRATTYPLRIDVDRFAGSTLVMINPLLSFW